MNFSDVCFYNFMHTHASAYKDKNDSLQYQPTNHIAFLCTVHSQLKICSSHIINFSVKYSPGTYLTFELDMQSSAFRMATFPFFPSSHKELFLLHFFCFYSQATNSLFSSLKKTTSRNCGIGFSDKHL